MNGLASVARAFSTMVLCASASWAAEPAVDREQLSAIVTQAPNLAVVAKPPLALEAGLLEWRRGVEGTRLAEPTLWCARGAELEEALVCSGRHPATLRAALLRASVFAEGAEGHAKGTLLPRRSPLFRTSRLAGFDLPGKEIEAFLAKVEQVCETEGRKRFCLTAPENVFFEFVRTEFETESGEYAVVVFPTLLADDAGYLAGATHELLHAQYFLDSTYRRAVGSYWEGLSEDERRDIVAILATHYDPTDSELMRNEFQAYLLQAEAENVSPVKEHVATHAKALRRHLGDAGAPALSFESAAPESQP